MSGEEAPLSPKSPRDEGTEAVVEKFQQFLDEWYYRVLSSSLATSWNREKSLKVLLDVLHLVGMDLTEEDKEAICKMDGHDEGAQCAAIVEKMPKEMSSQFDAIALSLVAILHEATRIRAASEDEGDEPVANLFEEEDCAGLRSQVLKASIVYAAQEVSKVRLVHKTWRKSTDARIDRLLLATEEAEHCQQQLLAAEAQLSEIKDGQKAKSKSFLMNMADGNDKTLMHTIFSGWLGFTEKARAEKEIRKKFEDQIKFCERKLFEFKEAQLNNVRGVVMSMGAAENDALLSMIMKVWMDEVKLRKADGDTAEELKALQDKMAAFESAQKEKAGQFMTRMAAGNEESLKNLCLEAWIKFHNDYAKDKALEDQVKAQEAAFAEHMAKKKDEAKAVLDRMSASSDSGLVALMFKNWVDYYNEEKKSREMEAMLQSAEGKFKSLNDRQKAGAAGVQGRVNEQMNANLMLRCFGSWAIETKVNRVENHYNAKYESKRRQLQGVQNLFKSFAMQLEQNLGADDDSSRTASYRQRGSSKSMKKTEGTVSLPDINAKP